MADSTEASILINAPAADVIDVIADFEAYPEWAKEVKNVDVLGEDGGGWADRVTFTLDAGAVKDTYTLEYDWAIAEDGTGEVNWNLVEATMLKQLDGAYRLEAQSEDSTLVTYVLSVDIKIPMLGMLKRKAEKMIVDTALKDLKKRVEG